MAGTECDHGDRPCSCDNLCRRRRPAGPMREGTEVRGLEVGDAAIRRVDAEHHLLCRDLVAVGQRPDLGASRSCIALEGNCEEPLHLVDAAQGCAVDAREDLHRDHRVPPLSGKEPLGAIEEPLQPGPAGREREPLDAVYAVLAPEVSTTEDMLLQMERVLEARRLLVSGDNVVFVAGQPIGEVGSTNLMKLHRLK